MGQTKQPAHPLGLAAADQFWLEYGTFEVVIKYKDLVRPQRYIKAHHPVYGEDPDRLFLSRYGRDLSFKVRLPDGTTVEHAEVFASVGKRGIVATFPDPHAVNSDSNRVYLLSDGTTFQNYPRR